MHVLMPCAPRRSGQRLTSKRAPRRPASHARCSLLPHALQPTTTTERLPCAHTSLRETSSRPAIPVARRGYAGDARHDWQQPEAFRHAWGRRMCMHGHRHAAGTGNPRPRFSALNVQRSTSKRKESCRDEEMDAGGRVDSRLRVGVQSARSGAFICHPALEPRVESGRDSRAR